AYINTRRGHREMTASRADMWWLVLGWPLDPITVLVLVILLLHRAPCDAMGSLLVLVVLLPGAVERFHVDVLGVGGQAVAYRFGQVLLLVVGHGRLLSPVPAQVARRRYTKRRTTCAAFRETTGLGFRYASAIRAPEKRAASSGVPLPGLIGPSCVRSVSRYGPLPWRSRCSVASFEPGSVSRIQCGPSGRIAPSCRSSNGDRRSCAVVPRIASYSRVDVWRSRTSTVIPATPVAPFGWLTCSGSCGTRRSRGVVSSIMKGQPRSPTAPGGVLSFHAMRVPSGFSRAMSKGSG